MVVVEIRGMIYKTTCAIWPIFCTKYQVAVNEMGTE